MTMKKLLLTIALALAPSLVAQYEIYHPNGVKFKHLTPTNTVLVHTATGMTNLVAGSAGQVLTSAGAAAVPTWNATSADSCFFLDTVSDLAGVTGSGTIKTNAWVAGYSSAGDGGQGLFYWKADGKTISGAYCKPVGVGTGYATTPATFVITNGGTGYTTGVGSIAVDGYTLNVHIVASAGVVTALYATNSTCLTTATEMSDITQGVATGGRAYVWTWASITRTINHNGVGVGTEATITIDKLYRGTVVNAYVASAGNYSKLPGVSADGGFARTVVLTDSVPETVPEQFVVYPVGLNGWVFEGPSGSGGWWRYNLKSDQNLRQWGANPDGLSDIGPALRGAVYCVLDQLYDGQGAGGVVFIPGGYYLQTTPLIVDTRFGSSLELRGERWTQGGFSISHTRIAFTPASPKRGDYMWMFYNGWRQLTWPGEPGSDARSDSGAVKISNFAFDGCPTLDDSGIYCADANNRLQIENLYFNRFHNALTVDSSYGSTIRGLMYQNVANRTLALGGQGNVFTGASLQADTPVAGLATITTTNAHTWRTNDWLPLQDGRNLYDNRYCVLSVPSDTTMVLTNIPNYGDVSGTVSAYCAWANAVRVEDVKIFTSGSIEHTNSFTYPIVLVGSGNRVCASVVLSDWIIQSSYGGLLFYKCADLTFENAYFEGMRTWMTSTNAIAGGVTNDSYYVKGYDFRGTFDTIHHAYPPAKENQTNMWSYYEFESSSSYDKVSANMVQFRNLAMEYTSPPSKAQYLMRFKGANKYHQVIWINPQMSGGGMLGVNYGYEDVYFDVEQEWPMLVLANGEVRAYAVGPGTPKKLNLMASLPDKLVTGGSMTLDTNTVQLVNAAGSTVTLPEANLSSGMTRTVMGIGAGTYFTVTPQAGDQINNGTAGVGVTLYGTNQPVTFRCDGNDWWSEIKTTLRGTVTLADATPTTIVTMPVDNDTRVGGTVRYTIFATTADTNQVASGVLTYSATARGTTEVSALDDVQGTVASTPAGSLLSWEWTGVFDADNVLYLKLDADTDLSGPSPFVVDYEITDNTPVVISKP